MAQYKFDTPVASGEDRYGLASSEQLADMKIKPTGDWILVRNHKRYKSPGGIQYPDGYSGDLVFEVMAVGALGTLFETGMKVLLDNRDRVISAPGGHYIVKAEQIVAIVE